MKHTRKAVAAVIGLVAALSLTACNGDDTASSETPPSSSPAASADKGSESTQDATAGTDANKDDTDTDASTDTGTGTNTKTGICRTDELEVDATDNTTDKTEGVVTVVFKNGGGRDCTIKGFAGVDLTASTGDTLSVNRNGEQPVPGVLKDGESAAFNITFPYNNSGGSGVRITSLVVTPPNETKHVTLDWPAGTLPVTDGESQVKLEISPVGKVSDSPAG
ncbi:DUF4232 domain-containing protein [Streptomyces sp. NBC_01283]|uniref:DUF4232 domain-containing protein n=1 Tax=Streptomyces sp. NBC_01283 TaxID=2903812 RepID=UPI00352F3185|nr:DUF4232 domain-containing protein [Streptomyces sp. NBC_01283]